MLVQHWTTSRCSCPTASSITADVQPSVRIVCSHSAMSRNSFLEALSNALSLGMVLSTHLTTGSYVADLRCSIHPLAGALHKLLLVYPLGLASNRNLTSLNSVPHHSGILVHGETWLRRDWTGSPKLTVLCHRRCPVRDVVPGSRRCGTSRSARERIEVVRFAAIAGAGQDDFNLSRTWIQIKCTLGVPRSVTFLPTFVNSRTNSLDWSCVRRAIHHYQPEHHINSTMAAVKKLDVHTASSDYSKTYVFHDEDHTLGNAVRHVLMRKCVFHSFAHVCLCTCCLPHAHCILVRASSANMYCN